MNIASLYLTDEGFPSSDKRNNQKFSEANLLFSGYSGSAGLTYEFTQKVSVKSNISRGYRVPNIAELASNGRHEGSLRYEYGSYNLKPENSWQADFSFLLNAPHISTEISVFQNNINNYIFAKKLLAANSMDSIPNADDPVPAYQYVQGKAQLSGGELTIDVHPHPLDWLHFENGLSAVYGINKRQKADSSRYLPFIPAPRFQSELRAQAKRWKNFSNLFIKLQYQHYWEQNRVLLENRTEATTPAYAIVNAGIGFDVLQKEQRTLFTFYFTVTNILDAAYQNHLSRLKYAAENMMTGRTGVYNTGRNFSFKLVIPLLIKKRKS